MSAGVQAMSRPLASALVVTAVAVAGCGGTRQSTDRAVTKPAPTSTPTAKPTPTPRPDPTVTVSYSGPFTTHQDLVTMHGRVVTTHAHGHQPRVHVKGATSVSQKGRKWTAQVTLRHKGDTSFKVSATLKGADTDRTTATITRKLSPAEIAAAEAAQRQAFIDAAQAIPYGQLIKDPLSYKGTKIAVHGQIFQIQQESGFGIMLVSVTDEGYGLWDDNVWVDYGPDTPVQGAEGDLVTVYGVVRGAKGYDTQGGGHTFVPRVTAKYIEG